MRWALQKLLMHQQNKMLGTDPILFSDLLDGLFLLNGVLPPPILLGRRQRPPTQSRRSATKLQPPSPAGCRWLPSAAELKPSAGVGGGALDCGRGCLPTVEGLPIRPVDAGTLDL